MKVTRFDSMLLKGLMLVCGLCLLMACSTAPTDDETEEIIPAELIRARAYDRNTGHSSSLPLNRRGVLWYFMMIELLFDKPVHQVSINSVNAESDGLSPAFVWTLDTAQLNVWKRQIGWNPSRNVTLVIDYEDENGVHTETIDVRIGAYSIEKPPPEIKSVNPETRIDLDANKLNREGIKIGFDKTMDTQRTRIVVFAYNGQVILNWEINWTEDNRMAILLPESEDDWFLPGHEYEIYLVEFYSSGGARGNVPVVIKFRMAS